ncbi:MAG: sodium-independent anion transporter, partial [Pseudomonadota bacterium]
TQAEPGLLIYRFGHSMYFANAPRMRTEIQNLVRDNTVPVRWYCIDISMVDDIDYTAQAVLQEIAAELRAKSIRLVFAQNVAQANAVSRQEVETQFGADSYFASLHALTTAFKASQTSAAAAGTSPHKTPSQSGR